MLHVAIAGTFAASLEEPLQRHLSVPATLWWRMKPQLSPSSRMPTCWFRWR